MSLLRRSGRIFVVVALAVATLALGQSAWAQNENETTGFRSNHAFESGDFGENIDVLTGGLTLTIPIGPKYEVNDRLGYQLQLTYNSKVWDYNEWSENSGDPSIAAKLRNQGPLGVGFSLHLGRIVQESQYEWCEYNSALTRKNTWRWVTQDGGTHDIYSGRENCGNDPAPTTTMITTDQSYVIVTNGPSGFVADSPDGLRYTFAQHVSDYDNPPDNVHRTDNLSFGGWYVTRIEDASLSGTQQPHVTITYGTASNYTHAIHTITDSLNRTITFHNGVLDANGNCVENATAVSRSLVATCSEPPRISRRPHFLRGWGHEPTKQVFARGT